MEQAVFEHQTRLKTFPPGVFLYITYRRLREQGVRTTYYWLQDKVLRRIMGFSPPPMSRIQPLLYVGGQHKRHGLARMRELGISAIVNMREEVDDARRGLTLDHYLWLATPDDTPPAQEDLRRGIDFIAQHIAAGRGVYIHCAAGVGRAPAMAVAYLISTGMDASQAWETIRRTRPFIRPTPAQIVALERFAAQWRSG